MRWSRCQYHPLSSPPPLPLPPPVPPPPIAAINNLRENASFGPPLSPRFVVVFGSLFFLPKRQTKDTALFAFGEEYSCNRMGIFPFLSASSTSPSCKDLRFSLSLSLSISLDSKRQEASLSQATIRTTKITTWAGWENWSRARWENWSRADRG